VLVTRFLGADSVGEAAEQTAAHGAALAEEAGFTAQPLAAQGTPTAKAVTDAADDHDASLIVLGAHRKAGLSGRVAGSVAAEVASRSQRPVMIVHDGAGDEAALCARSPDDDPFLAGPRDPGHSEHIRVRMVICRHPHGLTSRAG